MCTKHVNEAVFATELLGMLRARRIDLDQAAAAYCWEEKLTLAKRPALTQLEAVSGYRPHALRAQVSAARPLEGTQKLVGGTLVALAALGPSSLDEGAGASAEPDSRIATNGSSDAATVSRTQGSDERVDLHYGHRKVR